jgi:hypothetical protein
MPPEVAGDLRSRAHGIIRSWLRGDVEGLVALTGDDADELLPMVAKVLVDALLQLVRREEVERQLEWLDVRR